ncbi:MAG: hypothetical protein VCA74_10120 [Deltaproteobacteria bacterium]
MTTTNRATQKGAALILVVWTFAVLAVLAGEFAKAMREEAAATINFKRETNDHYLAIAAINEAIFALQARRSQGERKFRGKNVEEEATPIDSLLRADGQWIDSSFNGRSYHIRVVDEGGKLSINDIQEQMLAYVLDNIGFDQETAATVADSILDWRDEDDLHRVHGAEQQYYETLPRPYRAKNGDFDAIEELLLVRGVSEKMFYGDGDMPGLREIFSVFNDSRRVNLRSMSPEVMRVLTGMDRLDADELYRRRAEEGHDISEELRGLLAPSGVPTRTGTPLVLTIEARVRDEGGRITTQVAVVVRIPPRGDGFRTYRWYDSVFGLQRPEQPEDDLV